MSTGGGGGSDLEFLSGGGEIGALMRARDWTTTPLGPPENWPQSLRTVVRILLTSRYQMWMGWGDDLSFFYNDAYRPTLGVKHEWALGASARKVWEEIWPEIGPRIKHVLETGEATWDEGLLLFLERSGYTEETYHTFSYSPLSNDGGDIVGMLCVVTEETKRIIGERRLSSLRELASEVAGKTKLEEIFAGVQLALTKNLQDLPFCLVYQLETSGAARLSFATGVEPGHPIAPLQIEPADTSVWAFDEVNRNGVPAQIVDLGKFSVDLPKGAWPKPPRNAVIAPLGPRGQLSASYFMIAGVNPYRELDVEYLGFINLVGGQIGAGLTNAQAFEEERRRAQALADIDHAKTTFFSNVSHEFRTPLTLMLSPLEELLADSEGQISDEKRSLVSVAHRNGIRLLKLVNTLLDFSRIEAGRTRAKYEPTDLVAYTVELASNFRSALEKANLKLVVNAPPLSQLVYVDREMWEKIILNLLSNAFKFTFEGEIGVEIKVAPDGAHVEVSVHDTGTGIPAAEIPHLFERFRRVEGARGRSFEGSGIGLALVQELVNLHGGSISVDSELNRGSRFTITLPLGTKHLPSDRLDTPRSQTPTTVRAQAYVDEAMGWLNDIPTTEVPQIQVAEDLRGVVRNRKANKEVVLLADDNADMRQYVQRLLESAGYQVEAVADGEAALSAATTLMPNLVLSDIMMPKLDGTELVEALRKNPTLRQIPIILLSARAGEEEKVTGLQSGADDYLTKPFSARELIARVRANIDVAAVRREGLRTENELRRKAELAQERAEAILGSISDGFMVVDADWQFTFANVAAERILGRKAEELIGKNYWQEYPATIGTELEVNYRRAAADRSSVAFEYFYTPWRVWLDIRAYPSRDGGLSVYFQDITCRKQIEEQLRNLNQTLEGQILERTAELQAKEARLRSIFGTSYTYQGLLALDGTLLDANPVSLSGIKSKLEDVIGKPFWKTPWFADTPGMPDMVRNAIASVGRGGLFRQEIHINLPVGGWRYFDFQMRPVLDENGRVVSIMPEAVEVTERRAAEEALRHAQKMEAIGQLTGGVAHDFNNLLTVIRSSADLLRRHELPPDRRRRYVDAISDTADRAAKLTGQLLVFARRHAANRTVFDAATQVELVSDMLATVVGSRISIVLDIQERPLPIETDANQFETALVNLAANARDAMNGVGELTIFLASSETGIGTGAKPGRGEFISVKVSDTGCGIPPEQIDKIFEPFFTTKEVGRGTGLGLSQVYGFAMHSGGTVHVQSKVGVGTAITMSFPRSDKPVVASQNNSADGVSPKARGRVLVVEDNAEVGEFSSQLLNDLGYETVLVTNGDLALNLLDEDPKRFDIVFSDVVMPGLDGVALGRQVRQRLPHLPFVLTSGYSDVLANDSSHEFELLPKPYSVEDLSKVLRRALIQ